MDSNTSSEAASGARRTVTVSFQVDVPPGVADAEVSGVFAEMVVNGPALEGWWVGPPVIGAVYVPGSQSGAQPGESGSAGEEERDADDSE